MSEIDLSSPEIKAAIKEAVEEATVGLKNKNTELQGALKRAKAGKTIDPADVEKLEADLEAARTEAADAKKAAAKAAKDAEAAAKRVGEVEAREHRLLVDNGLNEALAKAGVTNPILAKAAKAVLKDQVQLVAEGDTKVAKVGDKSLAEFITKDWAGSDEGKHFVAAHDANGGGSQGGRGNTTSSSPGDMGGDKAARIAAINAKLSANS